MRAIPPLNCDCLRSKPDNQRWPFDKSLRAADILISRGLFKEVGPQLPQRMDSLKEKIALVTGASSGVGRAIARELGARGALVLLLARDIHRLELLAAEIDSLGGAARPWPVDLTDDDALQNFAVRFKTEFAGLDFLVHSAGIFRMAPIASAPVEDFDAQYRCNVRAPFALTQECLPQLIAARGTVAFINSTAGETTHANVSQYAATKHALKAVADTLRLEMKGKGVRVLSLMLGRAATPMQEEVCRLEGSTYNGANFLQPQDVADAVVSALTLPTGAEVTNLYLRPAQAPAPVPVPIAAHMPPVMDETGRWTQRPQVLPESPIFVPHE
jgi:NADP-dependent 3-hydroxy acid dehydrogenase YdfG